MRKVFESGLRGFSESASKIYVYEFDDEYEAEEFYNLEHDERCGVMGVFDERGYDVMPGALYHGYDFSCTDGFLVMTETSALNV
ncbi:MAG: hypothetical protein J6Y20_07725 [Lachnospiraceae bacterium]|nr:hypothetical protein [Lachnospiraceae bacterium]